MIFLNIVHTPTQIKTEYIIQEEIRALKVQPDRIMWTGVSGYAYTQLFASSQFKNVPKIALWHDEPVTGIERCGFEKEMGTIRDRKDFITCIWDDFWRVEAMKRWRLKSINVPLSIDEVEYVPFPKNPFPNHVCFVGCLQSMVAIQKRLNELPQHLKNIVQTAVDYLNREINKAAAGQPCETIPCGEAIIAKDRPPHAWESMLIAADAHQQPLVYSNLRWIVWSLAKNAVRIQILRKALQVSKVAMFCEMSQLDHAKEPEIRSLIGSFRNLSIFDTSNLSGEELYEVYSYGSIQIQATDPQSVYGGIPYRVFQTAAVGKALLTDSRPELEKMFKRDEEMLYYKNATDFSDALQLALMKSPEQLQEIGRKAREEFLKNHTWSDRIRQIEIEVLVNIEDVKHWA